jgi:hypothetical protein
MHTEINYSKSPSPKFDAVEDCKDWFGDKWDIVLERLTPIKNCRVFSLACSLAGVQGFPVIALYELINGEGSWKE